MKAKRYTVTFERDEEGWWVASVRTVPGVHTQGRTIDEARRHVREALALSVGDQAAERADLVDDVRLPRAIKHELAKLARARANELNARSAARVAAQRVARTLTRRMKLSRRDAASLTGYSFQRIQQLMRGG